MILSKFLYHPRGCRLRALRGGGGMAVEWPGVPIPQKILTRLNILPVVIKSVALNEIKRMHILIEGEESCPSKGDERVGRAAETARGGDAGAPRVRE